MKNPVYIAAALFLVLSLLTTTHVLADDEMEGSVSFFKNSGSKSEYNWTDDDSPFTPYENQEPEGNEDTLITPSKTEGQLHEPWVSAKTLSFKSSPKSVKHDGSQCGKNEYIRYKVKSKDTLFRISKKYQVTVGTICSFNNIQDKSAIKAGMIIKIPVNAGESKSPVSEKSISTLKYSPQNPLFIWPVKNVIQFKNEDVNGVKSIGITITGKPGSSVISAATGVVKRVGHMRGYGNYIVISHKNRFVTVYANLNKILVAEGAHIKKGETIAQFTNNGTKLHFQIDHEGKPTNPLKYLPN